GAGGDARLPLGAVCRSRLSHGRWPLGVGRDAEDAHSAGAAPRSDSTGEADLPATPRGAEHVAARGLGLTITRPDSPAPRVSGPCPVPVPPTRSPTRSTLRK